MVARVPVELQGDPGLVYDQVRWYRRRDYEATARQLLLHYRVDDAQPDQFWRERGQLARSALSAGNPGEAYRLASEHGFTRGSELADSEWLAGWIALRFLQQPEVATPHFLAMFESVTHPVSRARGAYWLGRTAAAMGDTETATLWYRLAAQHPVAFYGQLSHAQLHPNQPLPLPADPEVSAADAQQFEDHELVRAIRLLTMAGERERQRAFVLRLAELSETGAWKDMTASLAHEINRPDLAVAVARQSIRAGTPLVRNGYPVLSITDGGAEPYAVEMPLVHAIVRQESSFDVRAVSPAGAQGLMQLMPATARGIAGTLALPYLPSDLTSSPEYNISLGRAYIGSMLNRFEGSYILALAAYNAGPSRVNQWLGTNGDPRIGAEAAIDWIELIPSSETRNYVQRCLENLQVYRARTGSTLQLAQTLDGDLLR
jgi:soluble lytic murein transglycosylase